jgi:hypothetical protein
MRKHIKYEASLSADLLRVNVVIQEQSHRGSNFGRSGKAHFRSACGMALESVANPEFDDDIQVYMRGGCGKDDFKPIIIPVEHYPKFKSAVLEYNEYFKGD